MNNNPNHKIKCNVQQCKYNFNLEDYCTLDVVDIGTHETNPTQIECTDCNSFSLK